MTRLEIPRSGLVAPLRADAAGVDALLAFAISALPGMRLPSGIYCYSKALDGGQLSGESTRYSTMVLLGAQRAESQGLATGIDLPELEHELHERVGSATPGDLGLLLWAASRSGDYAGGILARLDGLSNADLHSLPGMEVAWLVLGTANYHSASSNVIAASLLRRYLDHLNDARTGRSGLPKHFGRGAARSRFPNFATLIYTLMALATVAKSGFDARARDHAVRLAETIMASQLDDGGWPWLFDATTGRVAERYEVYSVHQNAMAPMAFLAMFELTQDDRYLVAATKGLQWSLGSNELDATMFDEQVGLGIRSIRRVRPLDRLALGLNVLMSIVGRRPLARRGHHLELNRTWRPYEAGWILEAWSGRTHLADLVPAPEPRNSVLLFDMHVDALTMRETVDRARVLVRSGGVHQHVVINAAKVVAAEKDPELRAIIDAADLVNIDGQAVVWAGRLLGRRVPERVAGIDLFDKLVEAAAADCSSIFLLGAEREVVVEVKDRLLARHPQLRIAGFRDGFWKDDDALIAQIREAKPDYLFLAIPSPRKEYWLRDHLTELGVPLVMGVGGTFDVVAGKVRRAPKLAQRFGLEWFWRFLQEPRRMWKRYLFGNAAFIARTAKAWWRVE